MKFLYLCSPIGVLAQLVERKVRNLEVRSSILLCSTKSASQSPERHFYSESPIQAACRGDVRQ